MRTAETPEYAAISNRPERQAARNAFSRLIRPYEEETLRDWAERNGLMADADAFNRHWQAQGQQGLTPIHDRLGVEVHDLHGENAVIERDAPH